MLNVYIVIATIVTVFVSAGHWFWHGNYHKNNKFRTLLTVITTLVSITFVSGVFFQILAYNKQKANEQIDRYNQLSKTFLDDIMYIFIRHPEIDYYYNDLMGKKLIDENTKRNYAIEHKISMLIFSKMAKFAIVSQQTNDTDVTDKMQGWMGHVFNTFIQSPTLQHYWINEYKPKLSGPASRLYMETHYNL
jgi:hypothetical protein